MGFSASKEEGFRLCSLLKFYAELVFVRSIFRSTSFHNRSMSDPLICSVPFETPTLSYRIRLAIQTVFLKIISTNWSQFNPVSFCSGGCLLGCRSTAYLSVMLPFFVVPLFWVYLMLVLILLSGTSPIQPEICLSRNVMVFTET